MARGRADPLSPSAVVASFPSPGLHHCSSPHGVRNPRVSCRRSKSMASGKADPSPDTTNAGQGRAIIVTHLVGFASGKLLQDRVPGELLKVSSFEPETDA